MTIYQRELIRECLTDHGIYEDDADEIIEYIQEVLEDYDET